MAYTHPYGHNTIIETYMEFSSYYEIKTYISEK